MNKYTRNSGLSEFEMSVVFTIYTLSGDPYIGNNQHMFTAIIITVQP